VRPRAKITIDRKSYEEPIGTKMNDLGLYDMIRYDSRV